MEQKPLAHTGVMLPEIGLGTWQYHGGPEPLRRGVALGATLIDTAEMYGTEGAVGEAVRGIRSNVFLATKVSAHHLAYADVLRACDASLQRLGVQTIDLYQVHWPNDRIPIKDTMRAFEELVDTGKIRYIGVSNFSVRQMQAAQAALKKHRIVSNQVLYSLLDREIEDDVLPYCRQQDITVIAYSPLSQGRLLRAPEARHRKAFQVLADVANAERKTKVQVALNWCTAKRGVIAIPKAGSVAHTEEDIAASGWRLTKAHEAALDAAFT